MNLPAVIPRILLVTALACLSLVATTVASAHATEMRVGHLRVFGSDTEPQRSGTSIQTIRCGQELPFSDANGTWQLRFQCFRDYGAVNWHFTFAPGLRTIAASWADEDGLRWWRNGAEQPKNSPHVVPLDYTLHGTMSRVYVGDILDYQDYITFRHNLGGGGTATVTFAGSIRPVY
jgi:hypothetical protein